MSKTIGILGCGWLGKALGRQLVSQNHSVRGTVRREEQMDDLRELDIEPFYINLTPDKLYGEIKEFLQELDALIISLPPGTRKNPDYDFAESIRLFLAFVEVYPVNHIIFISSTSVFKDQEGIPIYDEESDPNGTSKSAKQLIAAEQLIQGFVARTTIIRPGGLIGTDRHPVIYLAGKKGLKNPHAPVNLVEQGNLVDLIIKNIFSTEPPAVVHAISEPHQSRKTYYQNEAENRGLELPLFLEEGLSVGKRVVSNL